MFAAAHDRALARCLRLESLSHAHGYTPAVWLALSQLHTLRHVDLSRLPLSAIAASLPRLHSLDAFDCPDEVPPDAMEGFFEGLLPRLRVFSFHGNWARKGGSPSRTTTGAAPAGFVLQELNRDCLTVDAETLSAQDVRGGAHAFFLAGPWAAGLAHRRLRSLQFELSRVADQWYDPPPADCATRLQQLHFPRLRVVQVGENVFAVDPDARRRSRSDPE
jgi:hypothetical protein